MTFGKNKMERLETYKQELNKHRAEFVAACAKTLQSPVPETADFGALYYQVDGRRLLPVTLSWMTRDSGHIPPEFCPFARFQEAEWIWNDEDLGNCIHEDAEEYFFDWVSHCWIDAGGKSFSPLFAIYDHGSMDVLDLCTLEELSDEDIEKRLKNSTKPNKRKKFTSNPNTITE